MPSPTEARPEPSTAPARASLTPGSLACALFAWAALAAGCADDPAPAAADAAPPPPETCGDGVRDEGEACDGLDVGGASCRDFGAFRGRLRCAPDCARLVTDDCEAGDGDGVLMPVCGNGLVEAGEDCDTADPEVDCAALGLGVGPLTCTTECRHGTLACCQAAEEQCNGRDDDCDGSLDEDTCSGEDYCVEGRCQPRCAPSPERCNGNDDDCDRRADEGFAIGEACSTGVGRCRASGVSRCSGEGEVECGARGLEPRDERCDGVDDDCDGAVDEGPLCVAGEACAGGRCVPSSCLDPIVIRGPGVIAGDTRHGAAVVSSRCDGDGPELVYRVDVEGPTCFDTRGSAIDTVLHLRTDCGDASTEIACSDDPAPGVLGAVLEVGAIGEALLFVDSYAVGGPFELEVRAGGCPEPCERCVPGEPARLDPMPDQRAPNDAGLVLRLDVEAIESCDRIRLRLRKRDGTDLGPGEYMLRVGDCRHTGAVRDRRALFAPVESMTFTTDFRGDLGQDKDFCVTKVADVGDPDPAFEAWWYSNFARVTRVLDLCR